MNWRKGLQRALRPLWMDLTIANVAFAEASSAPGWMTPWEIAHETGAAPKNVYAWLRNDGLRFRYANGQLRVRRRDFNAWKSRQDPDRSGRGLRRQPSPTA